MGMVFATVVCLYKTGLSALALGLFGASSVLTMLSLLLRRAPP